MNKEMDSALLEFTQAVQEIAVKAVSGMKPAEIRIAEVRRATPLQVYLPGLFIISEEALTLTQNVTNYEIEVEVDWETETSSNHKHSIKGKKTIKINNGLKVGEKVLIFRSQGGDKYIVIDKLV